MPSLEGIWNFDQSGTALVAATLADSAQVRGKFGLGMRLLSAGGTSLDLSGSCDGVGADELQAVSGEAVRLSGPLKLCHHFSCV